MKNFDVAGYDTMSSAIKDAHNYHNYLRSIILQHLGKCILEIGPGYGQYTKAFCDNREVYVVDIDISCIEYLRKYLPNVKSFVANLNSSNWMDSFKNIKFDSIIAMNVLEHIEDDKQAIKNIHDVLIQDGQLLIIVPAHNELFGQMDKLAGHYRRYNKKMLSNILISYGFNIEEIFYINPVGGLGWFLNAKFYKPVSLSTETVNSQILFFDKYILPLSKLITPLFKNFFGQSLWCRAVRTD